MRWKGDLLALLQPGVRQLSVLLKHSVRHKKMPFALRREKTKGQKNTTPAVPAVLKRPRLVDGADRQRLVLFGSALELNPVAATFLCDGVDCTVKRSFGHHNDWQHSVRARLRE